MFRIRFLHFVSSSSCPYVEFHSISPAGKQLLFRSNNAPRQNTSKDRGKGHKKYTTWLEFLWLIEKLKKKNIVTKELSIPILTAKKLSV